MSALYPRWGHPLHVTKAIEARFSYQPLRPLEAVSHAIEQFSPDLIVPCDDRALSHLHCIYQNAVNGSNPNGRLMELIERSLGAPTGYGVVSKRCDLLNLAREEGIAVPDTSRLTSAEDLEVWGAGHALPWVVKTDGSWGGHGVRIVQSESSAKAALAMMAKPLGAGAAIKRLVANRDAYWLRTWLDRPVPSLTVQAYIQGRPANRAVFCWQGTVLAGISVEVVASLSETGPASIVRVVENRSMSDASERLARRLHLSGFHGFDFIIPGDRGRIQLIEVNPRCTPLCHLQLGPQRDLVSALLCALSGVPSVSGEPLTDNEIIAYYPNARLYNPESGLLSAAYYDVPFGEPALTRELLRLPWPDRSLLARVIDRFRNNSLNDRSLRSCVFVDALDTADSVESRSDSSASANKAILNARSLSKGVF